MTPIPILDDTFLGKGTCLISRSAVENIHTYQYWTLLSVPDTAEMWFQSKTTTEQFFREFQSSSKSYSIEIIPKFMTPIRTPKFNPGFDS